jgi:hypothetical protein
MAQRSLFIARSEPTDAYNLFGFLVPMQSWLAKMCGFGVEFVNRRGAAVDMLFSSVTSPDDASMRRFTAASIMLEVHQRDIYVLGKSVTDIQGLEVSEAQGVLRRVATGNGWVIDAIVRSDALSNQH